MDETTPMQPVRRIGTTAMGVLLGTVLAATVGTLAVSLVQTKRVHERQLSSLAEMQARSVNLTIEERSEFATYVAARPMVRRFLAANADRSANASLDPRALDEFAQDLLRTDVTGLSFRDSIGREVHRAGTLPALPPTAILITGQAQPAWLYWANGPVLRLTISVEESLRGVGSLVIDQRLARLASTLEDFRHWGETGELGLCGKREGALQCLPLRFRSIASRVEPFTADGTPLPAYRAARGDRGVGFARDYRDTRVLAAWEPVGETGMGLVVKMDAMEVFGDVREQLVVSVLVIAASLALGLVLVRTRVSPLVARLRASERMAIATNGALSRVTESLQQSERRMRTIADNLPALIAYIDRNGKYTFANRAFEGFIGVRAEDAVGRLVSDVVGPEGWERIRPGFEQAMAGFPVTYERTEQREDGARSYLATYIPDVAPDGTVLGFHAMVQDISGSKRAEEALRAGEARLRTITDNVPVLIGYIDRERIYRFNNRPYADWFRRPIDEITGRPVVEVIGPELYEKNAGYIDRAMAGETITFEYELSSGATRHLKASFVPDVDGAGAVRGLYTVTQDVTAETLVAKELNRMARFDSLTGLPNRSMLRERIQRALPRAKREKHSVAVLYLDLDRFKAINDTLGHAAGDHVLREFGRRLTACVRETDTVARLAGDEFVVLLENVRGPREAEVVAEKILAAMITPMVVEGVPLAVRTSIGIAVDESGTADEATLLEAADAALYEAKGNGRGSYALVDRGLQRRVAGHQ